MTPETKNALSVKLQAVEFMKEQVFRGDFDRPRLKVDAAGAYHFKDKHIHISCTPSGRDGWLNCSITVLLARRRWLFRKLEPVLSTGFGVEVSLFRPGQWVDYVSILAERARELQLQRDNEHTSRADEEARKQHETRFGPVDDSSLFKK